MAEAAGEGGALVPVGTLATLFNLTERRVQQLAADGIIPRASRGQYPLVECVTAYIRHLQEIVGKGSKVIDIREAEARLKFAKAELAEGEAAVAAGRLIPVEEVERSWGEVLHQVRAAFQTLPDEAATAIHDLDTIPEKRQALASFVDEALRTISEADVEVDPDPTARPPGARTRRANRASSSSTSAASQR